MATYQQIRDMAVNQDIVGRLAVALVDAAIQIYAEDDTTPNHANRVAYAKSVASSPMSYAERMIWAVALMATGTQDADLKEACLLVWNAFAGIEVA